jgi:aspartate/methionine/tyrosine aminotransferase
MHYSPEAKGLLTAREAVARYYAELPKPTTISPDHVLLTTSTSEAYSFIFRLLCDPHDEVLVPQPSYPLFDLLADVQDVRTVPYPLLYDHGWHIDLPSLEKAITPRTRAVILVHPNNPTGSFATRNEMQAIEQLCAERQLSVIADEVFLDYTHRTQPESFASKRQTLTFTLSGLSKVAGLPQMKVAWAVVGGPEPQVNTALSRLEVIADTYLSMNAPIQHAVPTLFETRHGLQRALMERLRANLAELDRQLSRQNICSRLEVEAGWYAILRVPATRTDEEWAIDLLRSGVIVQPGHFFDFPADGFLVLSLMTPAPDFAEGLRLVCERLAPANHNP